MSQINDSDFLDVLCTSSAGGRDASPIKVSGVRWAARRPQVPGPSVVRTQARPSLEMDTQELRQVAARRGKEVQKRFQRRLDCC